MASSGIQTVGGVRTGITALAGGTGASNYTAANTLNFGTNVVSVCATAGDAVILPAGIPQGGKVILVNLGVAVCDVTPNVGGTLNGGGATVQRGVAAAGGGATFIQTGTDGLTWVGLGTQAPTA